MNPFFLTWHEVLHRWKSSLLVGGLVALITAALTYLTVNNAGFQKEISRNARDIGSNVVILPSGIDLFDYHARGGVSEATMPIEVVDQLVEYRASLNHLIPMLEREVTVAVGSKQATARAVGLSASVPVPGRPKSPMQKSIPSGKIQLGSALAKTLGVQRDDDVTVVVQGKPFSLDRVNRESGTWQDASLFLDLKSAQSLLGLAGKISRIEAIECTRAQCEATGLQSEEVLANELARITDQAILLRRDKMASARSRIRIVSRKNLRLLHNGLWGVLAGIMIALSALNAYQRSSEIGVLQSLGYGRWRVMLTFVLRAVLLAMIGSAIGIAIGAWGAMQQSQPLFLETGKKLSIDWHEMLVIGLVAVGLAALASSLPAWLAAQRDPAETIGKEG